MTQPSPVAASVELDQMADEGVDVFSRSVCTMRSASRGRFKAGADPGQLGDASRSWPRPRGP